MKQLLKAFSGKEVKDLNEEEIRELNRMNLEIEKVCNELVVAI